MSKCCVKSMAYRAITEVITPKVALIQVSDVLSSIDDYFHQNQLIDKFDCFNIFSFASTGKMFDDISKKERRSIYLDLAEISTYFDYDDIEEVIFKEEPDKLFRMTKRERQIIALIMNNPEILKTCSMIVHPYGLDSMMSKSMLLYLSMQSDIFGLDISFKSNQEQLKFMRKFVECRIKKNIKKLKIKSKTTLKTS